MTTEATGKCPTCGTPYPEYFMAVRELLTEIELGSREQNPRRFWKIFDVVQDMTIEMEKDYDQA